MNGRLLGMLGVVTLCVVPCAAAQSVALDTLPHAFPRAGARQILANTWVMAWDVTWSAGVATPMHRHRFDFVGVELATAKALIVSQDSVTDTASFETGDAWFLPRDVIHQEAGVAGKVQRHAVIIDLRDTVAARFPNAGSRRSGFANSGATAVARNDRVALFSHTLRGGRREPTLFYERNAILILVDAGEITITEEGGAPRTVVYEAGSVVFLPGGIARSVAAMKGSVRTVVAELN